MVSETVLGLPAFVWESLGVLGALIFCGRFYVQWYFSEREKRSVVPIGFWYMSSAGSLMILPYAVFYLHSPLGALSHCFNIVVYARNLIHIWRAREALSQRRWLAVDGGVALVVAMAMALVAYTWLHELGATRETGQTQMLRQWFWIGVGVAGQGLFGVRFLIQWLVTEARRRSVMPHVFWYVSIVAALLMMVSYLQRPQPEWLLAATVLAPLPVYVRNLWLIRRHKDAEVEEEVV